MTPAFERVAILGVGLLGASLGLALKQRGLAGHILGIGRRLESLEAALRIGAIDAHSLDPASAAAASLIVIATPAALVEPMLDQIRPILAPGAVVTDVASTKAAICQHAAATWPAPRRFVGSHPMAGSEKFGPEHGDPELYTGSVCFVESSDGLDPEATATVQRLWEAVGAQVVRVAPAEHDLYVARTSHLPHVLAAAIAEVAGRAGDVRPFVGNGFRDTTRIAAGRAEVWRDISLTNRDALLATLDELQQDLGVFRAALEQRDGAALEAFFEAGRAARLRILG